MNAKLLIGGVGLHSVTVAGLRSTPLPGMPAQTGWLIGDLAAGPHGDYALVGQCDATYGSASPVYEIAGGSARPIGVTADSLLGGAHHAWQVTYPSPTTQSSAANVSPGAVLTPLDGGPTITLEPGAYPVADTAAGLVVAREDPTNPDSPPALEVVNPSTGALVRALGDGYPLAADGHSVLTQPRSCGTQDTTACTLEGIDITTAKTLRTYSLPVGRAITSEVSLSADGRLASFQLTRTNQDPRFASGHPAPPSDVAILHLDTGRIDVVPGLEMAPKTQAGVAFDSTDSSIFITVSQGDHGQLLIWQTGMPGPALITTVAGPIAGPPPLLVLGQ